MTLITFNDKAKQNAEAVAAQTAAAEVTVTLKAPLSAAAASRAAATEFLNSRKIKFKPGPGGLLVVPGSIDLEGLNLTQLPDLSYVAVKGDFRCANNHLSSLKGAPCSVGGVFDCGGNRELDSLEFAPGMAKVFICSGTSLTSLESCPQNFETLNSPFGVFQDWDKVPQKLRISPASLAKDATTLSSTVSVNRPLNFRMGATA